MAAAHDPAAFVAVFAVFVLLSLVLFGFVLHFALRLGRERKAAAAAAALRRTHHRRRSPP